MRSLLPLLLIPPTFSYSPDTLLPFSTPACACVPWSKNLTSLTLFSDPTLVSTQNSSICALPALAVNPDPTNTAEYDIYDGYCLCDPSTTEGGAWYSWCTPSEEVPTQINLLATGATSVVVNFVVADGGRLASDASSNPVAELKVAGSDEVVKFTGFSTLYSDSTSSRSMSYFNVPIADLSPRTSYTYRVSGSSDSPFSSWSTFRSLYSEGTTKFAMYADMGIFGNEDAFSLPSLSRHNIGNVLDDFTRGDVDFIVHSGDHAYEFEVNGGARGDGYMDQYSAVLRRAPWLPGWGNHEYLEMDRGNRLGNITAGLIEELGQDRMHYSVDVGLVHIVQLDLSPYYCNFEGCYGVDTCGFPDKWLDDETQTGDFEGYREELLTFLESDLDSVDRDKTPWVIVTSHFPMYDTTDLSASSSASEKDFGASGKRAASDSSSSSSSDLTPSRELATADIEPLLLSHNVDIYFCGHNHNYETTWPVYNGTITQKDFVNPKAPVHILAGSAGPPETDVFTDDSPDWSREPRLTNNSYSRVHMWNATHMRYQQVANDDGVILDSFVVVKE